MSNFSKNAKLAAALAGALLAGREIGHGFRIVFESNKTDQMVNAALSSKTDSKEVSEAKEAARAYHMSNLGKELEGKEMIAPMSTPKPER